MAFTKTTEKRVLNASNLHSYQLEAIDFVQSRKRCVLFAPMGFGKTVATLTALEELSLVEDVYPALVLCPKRVALSTWPEEPARWGHLKHLRVSVVVGTVAERKAALAAPADLYTSTYDLLDWLVTELGDKWRFKTVVADEVTKLKSYRLRQGGKRAGALAKVAHTKVDRFLGLTGTPAANGIKDLWGQFFFVDKGERLGKSFSAFKQRWFRPGFDGFSLEPFPHSQKEIEDKLADVCLTVKGLPVDAPIVQPIYVDLDPKSRALYRKMENEMFAWLEENGVEAVNAAVKTNKLLQICNGAMYVDDQHNWSAVHGLKIEALESVVEEANGAPVLVSYNFKSDMERLLKHFRQARVLDANPDTIKRWNAGQIPVLLAHPASAGHGLSLQDGGNILARFGVDWNLELYMQIIERIGPLRQKQSGYDRPVFDYPILARDTMDNTVMERLSSKRSVQDVLLEAMKRRKGTTTCAGC